MALYGSSRDIALFRHFNREMLYQILSNEVDIYKISISDTSNNIYGESLTKTYYTPTRFCCKIDYPEKQYNYGDGMLDVKEQPIFYFLRDDLKDAACFVQAGDIISWNTFYYEIDRTDDNKLFMHRNPETNKSIGDDWGWQPSIVCYTHLSRKAKLQIEDVRAGRI